MANYTFTRFVSPNATVVVSELGPDISTTADDGKGLHNLDVNGMRINGGNALTSAGSITGVNGSFIDMDACSPNGGLVVPIAAGASPTVNGQIAFDSTKGGIVSGSNGGTAIYANSTQYGINNNGGVGLTTASNVLSGNVSLNNTANYFDGPSMAQGTTGTWWASGSVTLTDSSAASMICKLWDATTIIASCVQNVAAGSTVTVTLSGFLASPAANIRISVRDSSNTTGTLLFNSSGNSKDASIYGFRIA